MRIYVASRFAAYERVRAFVDDMVTAGHEPTHDWTRTPEFGRDGHPLLADPEALTPGVACTHAQADLRGVRQADLVVFLADGSDFCGALLEVGSACALGVPVWVVAPWRRSIFWHLPNVTVMPSEDAAREGLGMAPLALGMAA